MIASGATWLLIQDDRQLQNTTSHNFQFTRAKSWIFACFWMTKRIPNQIGMIALPLDLIISVKRKSNWLKVILLKLRMIVKRHVVSIQMSGKYHVNGNLHSVAINSNGCEYSNF